MLPDDGLQCRKPVEGNRGSARVNAKVSEIEQTVDPVDVAKGHVPEPDLLQRRKSFQKVEVRLCEPEARRAEHAQRPLSGYLCHALVEPGGLDSNRDQIMPIAIHQVTV
jgi:hypothetical protein